MRVNFYQNVYHGKGILEKADGTVYVGDFEENVSPETECSLK